MEILDKNVDTIVRDKKLLDKINNIEIKTISDLTNYSQKELAEKGIENFYIKDIVIALQSNGLDLKKNSKRK
jgi:uncharacterized protein YjgD (DUF1641 family)